MTRMLILYAEIVPKDFSPLSGVIVINWISSPESQVQLLEGFIALFIISTKDSLCN